MDLVTEPEVTTYCPVFLIKSFGEIIGLIGFKRRISTSRQAEIGYWLVENKQGYGIITTAMMEILRYAFVVLDLKSVLIKCGVENFPSRKIPEKLGFSILKIEPEGEKMSSGERIDLIHYLLREQEYYKLSSTIEKTK